MELKGLIFQKYQEFLRKVSSACSFKRVGMNEVRKKTHLPRLNLGFPLPRPTPRIPLPCRLPSRPSHPAPQNSTPVRSTASGPASVRAWRRPARRGLASSWMVATAARPAPGKWVRCAMRQTHAITTRDCTVTTARTSLGTKKEFVHVSFTHRNWYNTANGYFNIGNNTEYDNLVRRL